MRTIDSSTVTTVTFTQTTVSDGIGNTMVIRQHVDGSVDLLTEGSVDLLTQDKLILSLKPAGAAKLYAAIVPPPKAA